MKIKKERIQKAIENAAKQLFEESIITSKDKLYLTKRQYELDPTGWKEMLRLRGLPDDAIEFIPEVFNPN